ncbi:MAG TPA: hypothetical protein VLA93_11665 [Pyrinomonadaceae bacterium]|nr:hypothetical protein [Pyrinomonadaceae bacterium]
MTKLTIFAIVVWLSAVSATAQQNPATERSVALAERAVAVDANGAPALEATLSTKVLNGAQDTPVTNVRMIVRNAGPVPYAFVSGLVTFYDSTGVRCGEGIFKADAVAVNESFETDTPGIRIRCSATSWRIVATNLLPRLVPLATIPTAAAIPSRLVISVDGETHPIQIDRPITLNFGDKQRTIVIRPAP